MFQLFPTSKTIHWKTEQKACSAIFWSHGFVFGVWATLIPIMRDQLHISPAVLGSALLALAAGGLTAMRLAGWLIRRFSAFSVLRWSGALGCLVLLALMVVHNVFELAGVLFLIGCGLGLTD